MKKIAKPSNKFLSDRKNIYIPAPLIERLNVWRQEMWSKGFSAEMYAGLLLDQNRERDVFDVWVGNEEELDRIVVAFEAAYDCTVIRENARLITVCCPEAALPID